MAAEKGSPRWRGTARDIATPRLSSEARRSADLSETDSEYIVRIDLPGADQATIEVTLEGSRLTILAESDMQKEEESERESGRILRRERRSGSMRRLIDLPGPVEEGSLRTEYENGVLEIRVKKAQ